MSAGSQNDAAVPLVAMRVMHGVEASFDVAGDGGEDPPGIFALLPHSKFVSARYTTVSGWGSALALYSRHKGSLPRWPDVGVTLMRLKNMHCASASHCELQFATWSATTARDASTS